MIIRRTRTRRQLVADAIAVALSKQAEGEAVRPAGRQAIDGARNVQRVTITLEEDQREALKKLGGSPWIRAKLREEAAKKT